MTIETADIYNKVVKKIAKDEKISEEQSKEIVDKHETWLVDMVEAIGEKNVSHLSNMIVDFHYDEVNN